MSNASRYKPVGWRNESHRHYLAAKGIKTRYNAEKLSFSDFIDNVKNRGESVTSYVCPVCKSNGKQSDRHPEMCTNCAHHVYLARESDDKFYAVKDMKDDEGFFVEHKFDSMGKDLRHADIMRKQQECLNELDTAVSNGEMTGANREKFMKEDFRKSSEDYLNGITTKDQFDDECKRFLTHHMRIHGRKLKLFAWDDKKDGKKGYDAEKSNASQFTFYSKKNGGDDKMVSKYTRVQVAPKSRFQAHSFRTIQTKHHKTELVIGRLKAGPHKGKTRVQEILYSKHK